MNNNESSVLPFSGRDEQFRTALLQFLRKAKTLFLFKKCNFVFLTKTFGTKTPEILPQLSLLAHLGILTQSSHAHDQQSTETNHDIEVFKKR